MSTAEMRPEPDRITGARHPRDTVQLFGQTAAERSFLTAFNTNRLHHGWLIHGPRGIGKATLAWSIARFLLATPTASAGGMFGDDLQSPEVLNIARDHPVVQRIRVGSESGLFILRRPYDEKRKRLKQKITIDEVLKLKKFFALSATDGGRRVVIVDAADDMNTNAANAILKVLEEPPEHCCLLLISHQPAGLLPTLRSRCWDLRLQPLSPAQMTQALQQTVEYTASDPKIDDFTPIWTNQTAGRSEALAELSAGSVGAAIRLLHLEGLALYGDLVALFCGLPNFDRARVLKLAEMAGERGNEESFDMLLTLLDIFLARLARCGVTGQMPKVEIITGEFEILRRAAPDQVRGRAWAEIAQQITSRVQHGRAVNLDPAALILDTFFKMEKTALG